MNEIRRIEPLRDSVGQLRATTERVERRSEDERQGSQHRHDEAETDEQPDKFEHVDPPPSIGGYGPQGKLA
jgi:hypothetical protein